jgi:hypothetical protein
VNCLPGGARHVKGDLLTPRNVSRIFQRARDVASPRTVLTTRAIGWATSALSYDDTTVSAPARHLGVDWHSLGRNRGRSQGPHQQPRSTERREDPRSR